MTRIVADSKIPFLDNRLEPLAQLARVPGDEITPTAIAGADALLVRTRTRCDETLLHGSGVSFIGTATIGTDHIDLPYCRARGITVASAPGCNAPAVAQYVHAALLQWLAVKGLAPQELTLGIVGVGHVGSIVARWARQLGYRVLLCDPPRRQREGGDRFVSLDVIARESDIVTFHTPLTTGGDFPSYHMCDSRFLAAARCRLVVNAARGAVCDTGALLGWHGDCVIDCWENEPRISTELLRKAFIATPHIAGYSRQGKTRATAMIIAALNQHFGWHITPPEADTPAQGADTVTAQKIAQSYNPLHDTIALKAAPEHFEQLRNSYPLRNELP